MSQATDNDLQDELEALKRENDRLREQNSYLTALFGNNSDLIKQYESYNNIKENLTHGKLQNDFIIVFDYVLSEDIVKVIRLSNLYSFNFSEDQEFKLNEFITTSGLFFEDDLENVKAPFEFIKQKSEPVNVVVKVRNKTGQLDLARLEINCFYDLKRNPIRVSCILKKIPFEEQSTDLLQMDVEMASHKLSEFMGNALDIVMYVNPDLNYYHVFQASGFAKMIRKTGTWNDFVDLIYDRLYPLDYGIIKQIFNELEAPDDSVEAFTRKITPEFRYADLDGSFRWKSFKVDKLESSKNSGFVISFFDVNDAVMHRQQRNLKEMNNEFIDVLSTVVEFRDVESGEHVNRIKGFTKILLNYANKVYTDVYYTKEMIQVISTAAAMHDIGKISVSDSILLKPGSLSDSEYDQMKLHTLKGCDILKNMLKIREETYYNYCYEICRHHHERYDGKGYPDGLKGDQIPLESQIVSLADVYDALISKRCYKEAYDYETSYNMIVNGECGSFSPKLLECFALARGEMEEFARENA